MSLRRVLLVSGRRGAATLRYRVRLAEEALRASGVSTAAVHYQSTGVDAWVDEADVVTFYRTPTSSAVLDVVERCVRRGVPMTFDVDDRVFLPHHLDDVPFLDDLGEEERAAFESDVRTTGLVVPAVQRVSGSTRAILDEIQAVDGAPSAGAVLPNGVGRVGAAIAERTRRRSRGGRTRVAYFSGSATHDEDFAVVEPVLLELMRAHPGLDLWMVGPLRLSRAWNPFGARVTRISTVRWVELPALIAAVDVNIAPLAPSPFTEAKSAIKWLEAALVGTPTVATASQPFVDAVPPGAAFLVPHGGDWSEPLERLVTDPALRREMGEAARQAAYAGFGPDVQARRYREFYEAARRDRVDADAVLAHVRRLRSSGATAPPGLRMDLEPYPFPHELADRTFGPRSADGLARQRRRVLRAARA